MTTPPTDDAWQRQAALVRHTLSWGAGSVLAGLGLAGVGAWRRDRRLLAFGLQNAGWGAVDIGIAVLGDRLRTRRMASLDDPTVPDALHREHRRLRRILLINVVLDAGYVVGGLALARWRWRRGDDGAFGASVGIVVQGGFLLVHDTLHTTRLGPVPPVRH